MATTARRFVSPVHAAVGATLCESVPTKRRACEPPRRCRFDGLASRRGFWRRPRDGSSRRFERPSVQRFVKAPRRRGDLLSSSPRPPQRPHRPDSLGRLLQQSAPATPVQAAVGATLCESAPTKRRAREPPRRGRLDGLAAGRGFWRRPWDGSFCLLTRQSVQRFVKAPRRRGELVSLPAAAVSTA